MKRNPLRELNASIRCLFRLLDGEGQRGVFTMIGLGFVNMVIEMGAVLSVLLLLFHLSDPKFTVYDNEALRFLSGLVPNFGIGVPHLIGIIVVAYVVKNALRFYDLKLRAQVSEQAGSRLSKQLFQKYLGAPLHLHQQRTSADLINTVWGASESTIRSAMGDFMSLVSDGLMMLAIFVVLARSSPGPTFALAVALGITGLACIVAMHQYYGSIGHRFRRTHAEALHVIQQALSGIREVKIFQRERYFYGSFASLRDRLQEMSVQNGIYHFIPQVVIEMIFVVSFGLMSLYAWSSVEQAWLLPLLGTYAFCGMRLLPASYKLLGAFNGLRTSGPVLEFLHEEISRVGEEWHLDDEEPEPMPLPVTWEAERLEFRYGNGGGWHLKGVSFRLEAGRSYAIVGESGSGKTTLLNLVAGLLDPDEGTIRVNDQPMGEVRRRWQRVVGYVAQEPFALSETIAANIMLGDSREEVPGLLEQVIRDAQLSSWIATLPEGVETSAGERGGRVSGGQRQRIAIARALYKRPAVLLFDEPTSSLDTKTERAMEEALLRLPGRITRVIVTHRLATARRCDEIIFMADGRLVALGTYDELVRGTDAFRAFAEGTADA